MKIQSDTYMSAWHRHPDAQRHETRNPDVPCAAAIFETRSGHSGHISSGGSGTSSDPGTSEAQQCVDVLQHFARTPDATLHADPHSAGVYRDDTGNAYIKADDRTYAVKFDRDNRTWRIHHPDEPAKPAYPVRIDERGRWEIHGEVGLKGGSPKISRNLRSEIKALLRDGWPPSLILERLGASYATVRQIKSEITLPDTQPLWSSYFRENAAAQLYAGLPVATVALDLGVHPRTVELIEEALCAMNSIYARPEMFEPSLRFDTLRDTESGSRSRSLPPETKAKAQALFRDGWTSDEVRRELNIGVCVSSRLQRSLRLQWLSPLQSDRYLGAIQTRLNAGLPDAQIARELGLQPETVRRVRAEIRPNQLMRQPDVQAYGNVVPPAVWSAGVRPPPADSPQPGTSTGGWTYPPGVRSELAFATAAASRDGWTRNEASIEPNISAHSSSRLQRSLRFQSLSPLQSDRYLGAIQTRLNAGLPDAQIARELGLQPETVRRVRAEIRPNQLMRQPDVQAYGNVVPPAVWSAGVRPPPADSPQPGTSTGGWTYPPGVRSELAFATAAASSERGGPRAAPSGIVGLPESKRPRIERFAQDAGRQRPSESASGPALDMPRPGTVYEPVVDQALEATYRSTTERGPAESVRLPDRVIADVSSHAAPADRCSPGSR